MKKLLLTLTIFSFIGGSNLFATAQAPDFIKYQKTEYELFTNPLEAYFTKFPKKRIKGVKSTGRYSIEQRYTTWLSLPEVDTAAPVNYRLLAESSLERKSRLRIS